MLAAAFVLSGLVGLSIQQSTPLPSVVVKNGTYHGLHQTTYNQDLFLGIPYAQPPVGNLRFQLAQALNTSWSQPRDAKVYSPECFGYGSDQVGHNISEDCLALNIVRPAGHEGELLPVGVWIHGGGFLMGGTSDQRYNLSFIVQKSVEMGKPIIGVSIAYRLSFWGFSDSEEVRKAGVTNLGLHDQRKALQWIQENVGSFGGDSSKVTIWGQSAGAGSVGTHLIAYGGRDDGLFRGAICQSGNSILPLSPNYNVSDGQLAYNNIASIVGCRNTSDTLKCLREVDTKTLNSAINATFRLFPPVRDGTLIQDSIYDQLQNGAFIKVPLISGTNTDEGTGFGPRGISSDTAFAHYLSSKSTKASLNESILAALLAVYPNLPAASDVLYNIPLNFTQFNTTPAVPAPYNTPDTLSNTTYGSQWRRLVAFSGDFEFAGPRRLQCQSWSRHNVSAYCYRFNAVPSGYPPEIGSAHFDEVAFVFNNLDGLGYAINPFQDQPQSYTDLSDLMTRMWVSFIHDGSPNQHGVLDYEEWPIYDIQQNGGVGKDYFFTSTPKSSIETDDWRIAGINYLNSLWKTVYGM
ncbi:uncharacterized protein A1O9_12950 [Exophiala aquamarina CBS 119918]|uniref:Carboxylic ester hydrolase n=1 Tax=Exophiala aquamarina CBS 119918 TaxID=1182545 RepID=A0A072NTL7_9EURO|nr:uncharacterized protein A1O9_12950 [Exophiala aquamarina CBS 119918]KEF50996.1 hypothetical protein A1O9_12950 [Exophiala aquamarina CBS 119918]